MRGPAAGGAGPEMGAEPGLEGAMGQCEGGRYAGPGPRHSPLGRVRPVSQRKALGVRHPDSSRTAESVTTSRRRQETPGRWSPRPCSDWPAPSGPGHTAPHGTGGLTSPSALPIGESRTKSGGAITSTRATASSFSCRKTQAHAWPGPTSPWRRRNRAREFVARPLATVTLARGRIPGALLAAGGRASL